MRKFVLDGSGTVEGIRELEVPVPEPRYREVLVRIRAASLNYLDLKILEGRFPGGAKGMVPLSDGAGEVVATGEGVRRFAVGDRVASVFFPRWTAGAITADVRDEQIGANKDGVLAEYVVFHEEGLVRAPDTLDHQQASTLVCAGLTAWQMLTGPRRLLPGETVLVQGTGGVSLFALQFARLAGARVIATTSSERKAERLQELGAEAVVNYRDMPQWGAEVRRVAGRGIDHVLEIGEPGTLEQSIAAAEANAQINLVGRPDSGPDIHPSLLSRALAIYRRISVGSRADFEAMNFAIDAAKLKPIIDKVFPAAEVGDAYRYLKQRGHFGKIVLRL